MRILYHSKGLSRKYSIKFFPKGGFCNFLKQFYFAVKVGFLALKPLKSLIFGQ